MTGQSAQEAHSNMSYYQSTQSSTESSPPHRLVPSLMKSSSSVSNSTVNTEHTSPVSSQEVRFTPNSTQLSSRPELIRESSSSSDATNSDASSYIAEISLHKGSKRTASGALKQPSPTRGLSGDLQETETPALKVTKLSADLQSRLKYAMFKVQNGWEAQNIDQIETLSKSHFPVPDSPATEFSRRESISSDTYLLSPMVRTSPSQESSRILQRQMQIPAPALEPYQRDLPGNYNSSLAPAPQIISPGRSRGRSFGTRAPPAFSKSISHASQLQSSPLPSALRANSILHNQAEKDAVDTLLFMSSPKNTNNMRNSSQRSPPSRTKKVEFDMRVERR